MVACDVARNWGLSEGTLSQGSCLLNLSVGMHAVLGLFEIEGCLSLELKKSGCDYRFLGLGIS